MPEILKPTHPDQLIELIQWAVARATPLAVQAGGSKAGIGRPVATEHVLDLSGFNGVSQYDPAELVLTAGAGTPLRDIEMLIAEHGQMLAFEPPNYAGAVDTAVVNAANVHNTATLGGTLAGNISGPRRFFSGAARDHFLGFKAVSGRGEPFKSGGRVVKNVTGFDLSKLVAGSWGTLAALWEVTVKVLPVPEKTRTLLIFDLDVRQAITAMTAAVSSPHSVSGATHLPAGLTPRSKVSYVVGAGTSVTALRLEGPGPSVSHRLEALKSLLGDIGKGDTSKGDITASKNNSMEELHSDNSVILWHEIADLALLNQTLEKNPRGGNRHIWRLSLPPTSAGDTVSALIALGISEWFFDQAGGVLWLACADSVEPADIRAPLERHGGHATLWRAEAAVRRTAAVFHPQPEALAALTRRVKAGFDPSGILNPGRMYEDL